MNKALAPKKSILKTTHAGGGGSRKKKCVRFSDPTAGISEMQDITLRKRPENEVSPMAPTNPIQDMSALFRGLLSFEEYRRRAQIGGA